MKQALLTVALLASACAAGRVRPTVASPPWAGDEAVWVDPHPGAAFGWGGSMEDAARVLRDALLTAGLQPGDAANPKTLQVKLDMQTGLIDFTFTYKLYRGDRIVDEGSFVGNDQPCWSALSSKGAKVECIARTMADRILSSKALAEDHAKPGPAQVKLSGRLAVLDLRDLAKDVTPDDARYFTDLVRGAVLKAEPQLDVMTRENLLVLLQASGKDLASCEGECEVDTGRRIGADAIVSGEIQKVGTRFKISLRLHETHEGRLLGAAVASGRSIDELDDSAAKAVVQLFEK